MTRTRTEPVSERLDRLLGVLSARQSTTAPALAHELGVSLRTVRRDLARLAARGVPLEAERGRGGGVRVPPRIGLGRLQVNHRDAVDLLLALAIAERLRSPLLLANLRPLRQKIGLAFPPEERARVDRLRARILVGLPAARGVSESLTRPRPSVLAAVQDGFFEQRALAIEYHTQRERTKRLVEPHYLVLAWPAWYLLVWDHLRGAARTLRVDRIDSARLTDTLFRLRPIDSMLLAAKDLEFAPV